MLAEGLRLTGDRYDYDANVRALLTAPTVGDHRPSVRVTSRGRGIDRQSPLPPGDTTSRLCLRDGGLAPPQHSRSSRQRSHQPPVDPPAVRIGRPRRELLDHPGHPHLRIRGTTRTVYLLIPQISRGTDPDLALLERLAHQRGRQVPAVFRLRRTAGKVKNTVIILHQDPARHRAQQVTVHLRNLQARRYGCLMPPVLHLGNGSHLPTVIN